MSELSKRIDVFLGKNPGAISSSYRYELKQLLFAIQTEISIKEKENEGLRDQIVVRDARIAELEAQRDTVVVKDSETKEEITKVEDVKIEGETKTELVVEEEVKIVETTPIVTT